MTDWTEETWSYAGVTLNNYAYGITATGEGMPERRGANRKIAYRSGTQWRRKWFDQRRITLSMFVQDHDATDAVGATDTIRRAQLNDNIDALKLAFGGATIAEQTFIRKVRTGSGLETRTGAGEAMNLRQFKRDQQGLNIVNFAVDVLMSDPFFYGASATQQPISAKDTPTAITNNGTAEAVKLTIVITGGAGNLVNPVLTNTDETISFTYTGTINNTDTVTFDIDAGTATHSSSGDVTTSVTHSGDRSWMLLATGSNTLELTADSGAGSVTVDYSPPFF